MTADEFVDVSSSSIFSDTSSPKNFRPWLRRGLRLPDPVPPRSETTRELRAPCKGGGFSFSVSIVLIWTAPPESGRGSLRRGIDYHEAAVWEMIETTVCLVARCYPPDHAMQVEEALVDKLGCAAQEWRPAGYRRGDVKWKVRLRVEPDEIVKDLQQTFWQERLTQDALMNFSQSQVAQVRDLTNRWRLYLGDLNIDDPSRGKKPAPYLARYLARLALKPEETAETMDALVRDLKELEKNLLQVVENAIEAHQSKNTYEFLMSYESALLLLMKHIGAQPVDLGKDLGYGGSDLDLSPMVRDGNGNAASA
jgi:hypothetical protein